MRKISVLLAVLLVCSAASAKDFNPRKVVLNLAVISDTHVNGRNTVPAYKFRSALIQERDYAARFGGLDGVVVVGDLADSPAWDIKKYTEFNDWKALYQSVFGPKEMPMVFTVGNHDIYHEWSDRTYEEAQKIYKILGPDYFLTDVDTQEMRDNFGCRHCVIGGCHILSVTPNGRNPVVYPKESIEWLDANLKALTEKDPESYVIVITHAMIYGTIYGSFLDDTYPKGKGYWSTKVLTDVLEKYPQAVVFGGHLHFPLNDPRSVWQGDFTVMGTASTRYMAIDNGAYDDMGGLTVMRDKDEFSQGLLLQFDNKGNMRAVRMDFYNQTTIGEPWTMKHPAKNGSHLSKYDHKRQAAANKAPVLKDMKALGGENKVKVVWSAAEDDEFAHTYFLTVSKGGEVVASRKVLSDFYRAPKASQMKKTWTRDIGLEPGEYEVSLRAVDSWGAESNILIQKCKVI